MIDPIFIQDILNEELPKIDTVIDETTASISNTNTKVETLQSEFEPFDTEPTVDLPELIAPAPLAPKPPPLNPNPPVTPLPFTNF